MTLTIMKDIRAELHAANDQGRRPTCLSFAASAAHRHARKHAKALSVEWLFYHTGRHAGTGPETGTTIPDTRTILQTIGQPEETVWPYFSVQPSLSLWKPPSSSSELLTCASAGCGSDMDRLRDLINQNIPVVIGVFISDAFLVPTSWCRSGAEVILGTDPHEEVDPTRGHAVVLVGHGALDGEAFFLLRNSWGTQWGYEGHAWISETYLAPRLIGAFTISKGDGDVLQSDGRFADAHPGARMG